MTKTAFVFPGQGSQTVGMGRSVCDTFSLAKEIFTKADEILGYSISGLCFDGPESELSLTIHTQPAIVATSYALAKVFIACGKNPDCVAGHSVGEYTALAVCNALSFEETMSLIQLRAKLMDEASPAGLAGMAALIGMDEKKAETMIKELSLSQGLSLDIAGLNCPGQVVIAGQHEALDIAISRIREFGGRMGMKLNVSGPFHSRLMQTAAQGLARKLSEVKLSSPCVDIYPNVNAHATKDTSEICECLKAQLTLPVLWEKTVVNMIAAGVDTFVEFGAGNVLAGMIKKIDRAVRVLPVFDAPSLDSALKECL